MDFCSEYACTSNQVSADGIRLDILKCLDLFRAKYGWVTSELRRGQTQPVKGATKWLVDIELPSGPIFTMGFYSQNTP